MTKNAATTGIPGKTQSPSMHYDKPQEIVHDAALTEGQKKKALATWKVDAEALQRAEDEGMSGGESSKLIDVVAAEKALAKKTETEKAETGKQAPAAQ